MYLYVYYIEVDTRLLVFLLCVLTYLPYLLVYKSLGSLAVALFSEELQGYLAYKKLPPSQSRHRALDIFLL